jgi:xyloglucan-specific exo-beta-1,4-glucanase
MFAFNSNRYAYTDDGWDTITNFPDPVTPVTVTGAWGNNYSYGDCAVDAVDVDTWYIAPTANRPYVTRNAGVSWTAVALPSGMTDDSDINTGWGGVQRQATYYRRSGFFSDKTTAGTVWIDHILLGTYRSTDYGASWTLRSSDVYEGNANLNARTRNWPGKAGHLWRAGGLAATGGFTLLEVSIDGGATWNDVPDVTMAVDFSMGKAAVGNAYGYDAYLLGRIDGVWGLFRSSNLGTMAENATLASATWTQIAGPYASGKILTPDWLEADKDTEGLCYLGHGGQGASYVRLIVAGATTRTIRLRGI